MMTIEELRQQIAQTENDFENAKAQVYRYDGALQVFRAMLVKAEAEKPATPDSDEL
jgi:hypothetical protein